MEKTDDEISQNIISYVSTNSEDDETVEIPVRPVYYLKNIYIEFCIDLAYWMMYIPFNFIIITFFRLKSNLHMFALSVILRTINVAIRFRFHALKENSKELRLVCKLWNDLTLSPQIIPYISCFIYDGRRDNQVGTKCETFLHESQCGFYIWNQMRLRRAYFKQMSWLNHELTSTINILELNNCSLSWTNIIFILSEFDNLKSFSDIQDMYCWDFSTFSEGLDNDELLNENDSFKELNQERLISLQNLKNIKIHRSQFSDCTIYLKMLNLKCNKLETLSVTTDQSLNPRPSGRFYRSLGDLIKKNSTSLQSVWFPYRHIYPVYEFRVDDSHPFRDFLNFVTENNWGDVIQPESLIELSIQFPIIHIDEIFFKQKLLPFLESWTCLKKLFLNCILLETGKENLLLESIPSHIIPKFGVWVSDNGPNGAIPYMDILKEHFQTLTIQTWRPVWTQVTDILDLPIVDSGESSFGKNTREFQYFNKSPSFRSFNLNILIPYFVNLTHLNLVDHNTRGERIHSSEALASVEDEDMQLVLTYLNHLTFLQINGNMTFLTDAGITGLTPNACKRILKNLFVKTCNDDIFGKCFSTMKFLRHVVLRGVGIKITDVSIYFGFYDMPKLKKLHVYGAQQVTPTARAFLAQKFPTLKGCDIQI